MTCSKCLCGNIAFKNVLIKTLLEKGALYSGRCFRFVKDDNYCCKMSMINMSDVNFFAFDIYPNVV